MHPADETLRLLEQSGRHLDLIPCQRTRDLFETITACLLQGADPREALDLTGAAAYAARLALRNDHLLRALRMMDGPSPWARCQELAAEIRLFQAIVWPRWRNLPQPPKGCAKLHACLFQANRVGAMPGSARQLRNIADP